MMARNGMSIVNSYRLLSPWQIMSITTVLAKISTSSSPAAMSTP